LPLLVCAERRGVGHLRWLSAALVFVPGDLDRTRRGQSCFADHLVTAMPQPAPTAAVARRLAGMIRGGASAAAVAGLGYYLVVTGKLTIDTGWGRRVRPLGPFGVEIAPRRPPCST
jgi:hypothetical protein